MSVPGLSSRDDLVAWLRARVASRLEISEAAVDVRTRFKTLGLDSMRATSIASELQAALGRAIPQTLLWQCPTIEHVVDRIIAGDAPAEAAPQDLSRATIDEAIAIVGIACRFPRAATPRTFYQNLLDGLDAIAEVPRDRWDVDAYFDEDASVPGKSTTRWGGFLDDVASFDPAFFGISKREARDMDPQQRIVLELAWEALERAGVDPLGLRGTSTGVFIGVIANDYAVLQHRAGPEVISGHTATGAAYSIVANRVSYALGLEGPSLAVDTACSASLVAVHLACNALRTGEATMALAGGVNLLIAPESTIGMSKFGAMAPDGRSKAFDARANGYVRGEGAGLLVLEPLSRALAAGRKPLAIVRGSAVNNDGFSNGLTAPSPQAQESVLRQAYRRAGIDLATVDYVETHGTGTRLGDPIEATAIGNVLGRAAERTTPLLIGSVKTNIGHLEAAAGIAGLVKTTLAIQNREIPPNLHFETPNPLIAWEDLQLTVPRTRTPWPVNEHPPRAGVSSFGFGGTNCHVVLEAAAPPETRVLLLAAADEAELKERARQVLAALRRGESVRPVIGEGDARLGAVHDGAAELVAQLEAFIRGDTIEGLASGTAGALPRVVFVCGGQGSQWPAMGRALAFAEPRFREALARCDAAISRFGTFSLIDEIARSDERSRLDQLVVIQPSIFAMQVAHAELYASWGITPDIVIGHSMGEIAAAHVAGMLDIDGAARVVCERTRLVHERASGKGRMAAIDADAETVGRHIAEERGVTIAAYNGPAQTIIAGDIDAVDRFVARLSGIGIGTHVVRVDYASHSPHMDALSAPLAETLRDLAPHRGRCPMLSTVTLEELGGEEVDASYWAKNIREPVRFAPAISRIASGSVFVELSPHPLLAGPIEAQVRAQGGTTKVLASARRGEDGRRAALETASELFVRGVALDASRIRGVVNDVDARTRGTFAVSFHSPDVVSDGLRAFAERARDPEVRIDDLCAAAAKVRGSFDHRVAFSFDGREGLVGELERRASLPPEQVLSPSAPIAESSSDALVDGAALPPVPFQRIRCWFDESEENDGPAEAAKAAASRATDLRSAALEAVRALDSAIPDGFAIRVAIFGDESMVRALGAIAPAARLPITLVLASGVEARRAESTLGSRATVLVRDPASDVGPFDVVVAIDGVPPSSWLAGGGVLVASQPGFVTQAPRAARAAFRTPMAGRRARETVREKGLRRVDSAIPTFEMLLDPAQQPWLADHVVAGAAVAPFALFLVLVRAALDAEGIAGAIGAIELESALVLDEPSVLQIALVDATTIRASTRRAAGDRWMPLFTATTRRSEGGPSASRAPASARAIDVADGYRRLEARGIAYAGAFRGVEDVRVEGDEAWATIAVEGVEDPHGRAACLLDAALQVVLLSGLDRDEATWVPITARRAVLGALPSRASVHVVAERGETLRATVVVRGPSGEMMARLEDVVFARKQGIARREAPLEGARWNVAWRTESLAPAGGADVVAVVVGGDPATAEAIGAELTARGARVHIGETLPPKPTHIIHLGGLSLRERSDSARSCAALTALAARAQEGRLVVVTRGAVAAMPEDVPQLAQSPLLGATATIALERPEISPTTVDLDPHVAFDAATAVSAILAAPAGERLALRRGSIRVARLEAVSVARPPRGDEELVAAEKGALDSLVWRTRDRRPLAPHEIRIEVHAAGMNFRDVMSALGTYPGDPGPLGVECSGIVVEAGRAVSAFGPGARVAAIAPGSFANEVVVSADLAVPLPNTIDFARGASIPASFVTASVALEELARVRAGERILVHNAAGGTGLAAIAIARRRGAEVLATAGSERKTRWLRDRGIRHVFGSRSPFDRELLAATDGRGVDVVFGSFGAALAKSALASVAKGGRFVEIAKNGVLSQEEVRALRPDVAYHVLALDTLWAEEPSRVGKALQNVVAADDLEALPLLRFGFTEAQRAFECMAAGRHVGKLVLENESRRAMRADPWRDGTTIITGAFGGIGLGVSEWLAANGARSLLLVGRSEPNADALRAVEAMRNAGTDVRVVVADVADRQAVAEAVEAAPLPVVGVVHSAGVLDDALVDAQDERRFARTLAPKVEGAWNLHEATMAFDLSFFVAFGSIAAVLGSPGQANHAAASFALAEVVRRRRAEGRCGTVIDWGPWANLGAAARAPSKGDWTLRGVPRLAPAEGFAAFGDVARGREARVMLARVVWPVFASDNAVAGKLPLVRDLVPRARGEEVTAKASAALSREELLPRIRSIVARLLGRAGESAVDVDRPLMEMGLDSLLAVELRNALARVVGRRLSPTITFNFPTVSKLADALASGADASGGAKAAPKAQTSDVDAFAIVGLACRFPGAPSASRYWDLLARGEEAIREVPSSRWPVDQLYEPGLATPGKMNTRWGAFVDGIDRFDHRFFGVSQREAAGMDPQQRLLLEVVWHALEDAAIAPDSLAGTATGAFVGLCSGDYAASLVDPPARAGTGVLGSITANRISYFLDLRGPSIVIDTACSSSLVALDLACQALRTGKCDLAIAAGANVLLDPKWTIAYSQAGMMSPDGRCKTFDRFANGFVRGEGCGAVILKRLHEALRDGDPIVAVVRGTAVRHDGRSSALTAPSGHAQQALIEEALASARIEPADVSYVEAHGTGTPLGDPIEIEALGRALSPNRDPSRRCLVGSVKTNIGHLEGAAGIAGVIKVALSLENELVPRHLNVSELSPHIDLAQTPLAIASAAVPWPRAEGARRIAGVSSFGLGGTIAHAVLEEPPARRRAPSAEGNPQILPLSARTSSALVAVAKTLADALADGRVSLADACATAALGRAHFPVRFALVSTTATDAVEQLRRLVSSPPPDAKVAARGAEPAVAIAIPPDGELSRDVLESVARAYVAGAKIDWRAVAEKGGGARVRLPGYPFERTRCWPEPTEIRCNIEKGEDRA